MKRANFTIDAAIRSSYTAHHSSKVTTMRTLITAERADTADARALVEELDAYLIPLYPPASHHGLTVEELIAEGVVFFLTRYDGAPAGCGGLKLFGAEYAEVKRMYVRPRFRGLGLGKLMLNHLIGYARERGIKLLRLETGILQVEAISLYEQMGFRRIQPFAEYQEDPLSRFYEMSIA